MLSSVMEFFGIVGVDIIPPTNFGELVPYLLQVGVGLMLAGMTFRLVLGVSRVFSARWWKV